MISIPSCGSPALMICAEQDFCSLAVECNESWATQLALDTSGCRNLPRALGCAWLGERAISLGERAISLGERAISMKRKVRIEISQRSWKPVKHTYTEKNFVFCIMQSHSVSQSMSMVHACPCHDATKRLAQTKCLPSPHSSTALAGRSCSAHASPASDFQLGNGHRNVDFAKNMGSN